MSTNYRIVETTPADYETIRNIAHATWPDTFGNILSGEQIDYMLRLMYSIEELAKQVAQGVVFKMLVEAQWGNQNGKPNPPYLQGETTRFKAVGYVGFQQDYLPNTTKIHKLYLLPSTQGKGYGKALINEVAMIARNAGQQKLRLDVNYQNKAIGFYEHLGFVKLERCNTDIGQGYLMEDWVMEMDL
ncbi:MAG: GNAT family N-acetyltransferase [Bacteroidota bacterium]